VSLRDAHLACRRRREGFTIRVSLIDCRTLCGRCGSRWQEWLGTPADLSIRPHNSGLDASWPHGQRGSAPNSEIEVPGPRSGPDCRDSVGDKVEHFEAGADEYLTKPFAFAELLVRVKALLRRGPVTRASVLRIGDLELDRLSQQVKRSGKRVELTSKEYGVLEYLVKREPWLPARH